MEKMTIMPLPKRSSISTEAIHGLQIVEVGISFRLKKKSLRVILFNKQNSHDSYVKYERCYTIEEFFIFDTLFRKRVKIKRKSILWRVGTNFDERNYKAL